MLARRYSPLRAAVVTLLCSSMLHAQNLAGWACSSAGTGVDLLGVEQFGISPSGIKHLKFTLKNISEREVSAIVVITPDDVTHSIDFFGQGHLAPGDTYILRVGTVEGNRLLRIVAVGYADGSFEGSSRPIGFLRSKRLGRALETKRLSDIYAALEPEEFQELGIERLSKRVGRLPDTAGEAIASLSNVRLSNVSADDVRRAGPDSRFAFLAGVSHVREDALRELSQLTEALASATSTAEGLSASEVRSRFVSAQKQHYAAMSQKQQQELEVMK